MRIRVKDIKEAEKLAEKFGETHIESSPISTHIWLVIDEPKRMRS